MKITTINVSKSEIIFGKEGQQFFHVQGMGTVLDTIGLETNSGKEEEYDLLYRRAIAIVLKNDTGNTCEFGNELENNTTGLCKIRCELENNAKDACGSGIIFGYLQINIF